MPSYKKYQDKEEDIKRMLSQGYSKGSIAKAIGMSMPTLASYLKEWGLTKTSNGDRVVRGGKYSHLANEITSKIKTGERLFDIADELNIPRGSISYVVSQLGLSGAQIKNRGSYHTKDGMARGKAKRRKPDYSGEKHHFYGLVTLRGKWVTREEFIAEAKKLIDLDMTYAEMTKELGVSQATLWARLKEAGMLQGLRSGERTPMWRDGSSKRKSRGPDWQKQRKAALQRDGYMCQRCGKTNAQELKDTGKQLSIHHIVPYRISRDSSLNNLISLCNVCHMQEEYQFSSLEQYQFRKQT